MYGDELVVEDNYSLIQNLSRGGLLYPHDSVVNLVLYHYIIFNKLLEHFEEQFLNVYNKRNFVSQLVLKYLTEEGHLLHFRGCHAHGEDRIANIIINSTTNTLLKNYCGKRNNQLNKGNKNRKLSTLTNK